MNKLEKDSIFFRFEGILIATLAVILYFVYHQFQSHISYEAEPLLDGHHYLRAYLYFNGDITNYNLGFPFNTRIGIPFLASLIPTNDPIINFKIIHILFIVASCFVIAEIHKHLKSNLTIRLVFWCFLLFHWLGPIRFSIHEPLQTDTSCYLILSLFILLILKKQYRWLLFLAPISILFKEVLPPFLVVGSIFYFVKGNRSIGSIFILSFALSLFSLYVTRFIFPLQADHWHYHGAITGFRILKMIAFNPLIIIKWFCAISATFGLLFIFTKDYKPLLKNESTWYLITSLLLGLVAGGDHSRILFSMLPISILFIHDLRLPSKQMLVLSGLSLPFFHLLSTIPNIDKPEYHNWFMEYADWSTITMVLSYIVGCYFFMKVVQKIRA